MKKIGGVSMWVESVPPRLQTFCKIERAWCLECKELFQWKGNSCFLCNPIILLNAQLAQAMSSNRLRHHTDGPWVYICSMSIVIKVVVLRSVFTQCLSTCFVTWAAITFFLNLHSGNTHQHLSGSQLYRGHYQQSPRHLQRHASDVSSDRLRYCESNYRPSKDVQRTDYPARKRDSRTDLGPIHSTSIPEHRADQHLFVNRDTGGSQNSQGSQGSGQVVFRQKPSSSSSLDRSSYSGPDSHTSSIRESGSRFKMIEPGYGIPNVLVSSLKSSGTPNSSQSDELHMERTSSMGYVVIL